MAQSVLLPSEICAAIEDMACRRVHNGTASNDGLMIGIDVDFGKKIEGDVQETLEAWLVNSIDKAHRALDYEHAWQAVTVIQWDQDVVQCYGESNQRRNGYRMVVRFDHSRRTEVWPLYEYSRHIVEVSPERVLDHFDTPPAWVRSIGVSGINQEVLRDEWAETIYVSFSDCTCPGQGYARHPMWVFKDVHHLPPPYPCPYQITETSYAFDWLNYPGNRFEYDNEA